MWQAGYTRLTHPLTILPTFEGNLTFKKKVFGRTYSQIISHFYNGKMESYTRSGEEDYFYATALKKISGDPQFMKKVESEVRRIVDNLLDFSAKLKPEDLQKKSDAQLMSLLFRFNKLYAEIFGWGLINTYDRDVVEAVRDYFHQNWPKNKATHYFTVLTSVTESTYYEKEKKDLFKAALAVKKSKGKAEKDRILNRLVKNYSWLFINYEGRPRTKKDFAETIQGILKKEKNPGKAIADLENSKKRLRVGQKKLEKELKIDPLRLRLIKAARQNAYLREYRKPLAVKSIFQERNLLAEIARRLNITVKELKFLLPKEIEQAMKNKKVDRLMIKKRMANSVYVLSPTSYKVLVGKKAQELLKKISQDSPQGETEVKGLCAYPGKVAGNVKLVSSLNDLKDFKKGEIFVGKATSPDLIPVFAKAKAIVTDEGGLTSHAAIISREVKLPCVVGTKNSTKIFKTGDRIEVDSARGLVKKIG